MNTRIAMPVSAVRLLPAMACAGGCVGISVSNSADLKRLGLLPSHFKLALRELARTVLVGGGRLAYGGHLLTDHGDNYTEFLIGELHRYAQSTEFATGAPALLVCLSWQEHRQCSLEKLDETDAQLGLHGELRCLDLNGQVLADRKANRLPDGEPYPTDKKLLARGLSALRGYLTGETAARLLLGGKRHDYTGSMPGVLEEALLALHAEQPLYLASGYGGVALDIAAAIDPRCAGHCPRYESDPPLDAATLAGLDELRGLVANGGWHRLNNALSDDENLCLATTHRPAEIAALVALGLGRSGQRPSNPSADDG